jgi:hypothetical protein
MINRQGLACSDVETGSGATTEKCNLDLSPIASRGFNETLRLAPAAAGESSMT